MCHFYDIKMIMIFRDANLVCEAFDSTTRPAAPENTRLPSYLSFGETILVPQSPIMKSLRFTSIDRITEVI